jgi:starch synthase
MIEVLSVCSEVYPLVKTGGLADVTGALPAALSPHGIVMRTLVPGYPAITDQVQGGAVAAEFDIYDDTARLITGRASGLDLIVLDAPHLFARPGNPYIGPDGRDWPDNWKRFAALSWAAGQLANGMIDGYRPDVVHAHDWQAGLAPAYVKYGLTDQVRTIMTVHNLAFQGQFGFDIFGQLQLPPHAFGESLEYFGGVGYLKAGLATANLVSTVSPTYAAEVRTTSYGMGLDGLLTTRADDLYGILNGIDLGDWDPATDPALAKHYTAATISDREGNKAAINARFELDDAPGPLFGVVSRLTWQKGLDMLVAVVDRLVALGGKLCVLGNGEPEIENGFRGAAMRHPGKVSIITAYDEKLSHLIQGGADVMLVPSRFEPCGLTQLFGLRYGCVPLVSRVGGLADTVIDANEAAIEAGVATGIVFAPATEQALADAIRRAVILYGDDKVWQRMQRRGMKSDVSWNRSAQKYADLYQKLTERGA